VSWFKPSDAGLSPQRLGFNSKLLHVRLVVHQVALEQVSLEFLWFFPLLLSFYHCYILIRRTAWGAQQPWQDITLLYPQSLSCVGFMSLTQLLAGHRVKTFWVPCVLFQILSNILLITWQNFIIFSFRILLRVLKSYSFISQKQQYDYINILRGFLDVTVACDTHFFVRPTCKSGVRWSILHYDGICTYFGIMWNILEYNFENIETTGTI
jgi:hypothetical protein